MALFILFVVKQIGNPTDSAVSALTFLLFGVGQVSNGLENQPHELASGEAWPLSAPFVVN